MEIDDHGKERRNALVVSAAIACAAFLQLKMPSFLAEFVKFDIPPEHAYRVWLLAAALALYTLMRFHFSDSRVNSSQVPAAAFAQALDTALSARYGRRSSAGEAHANWAKEVRDQALKSNDGDFVSEIDRRHFEPYDFLIVANGVFLHWRIRKDVLDQHAPTSDRYTSVSHSVHALSGPFSAVFIHVKSMAFRVFWSKTAVEINTVYFMSFAAISASVARAVALL
ncbi:hypothetical protein I6I07_19420 [Achromobacter deleyi]|uniref:Uncharacterized protein n=1 Tax=Achromobacter deleyi TaxID=1353891 RepID=A0A7T4AZC1_9BURK|nr:hypothetical protein [Achromobacter deleyi]QQB32817.1 hypothetical protein I6I07_19420 [Achromobacter deleyi]